MMIITEKGTPRRYSEEELKQDLLKAMEVIQDQQQQTKQHDKVGFFDYGDDEVDKNIDMQKEIYAGLFGLYDPAITSFEQLADDKRGTNPLSAKALASKSDEVVDRILTRINLIGGLKREKQRVDEAILDGSTTKLEQCLIREAALGHETLIDSILSHDGFKPDLDILIKAKNAAAKNHHETLAAKVGRMLGDYQNDEQDVNRLIEGAAAEISETTDSIAWCHKIAIAELRQIEVCDKYNSKSLAGSVSDFFQKPSINDHNFTKMRDYLKQELSAPEYKRFLTLVSKSNPKLTQRLIGQFASGNFEQLKGDINHDQIEEIYETHNTIINQIKAAGGLEEVNQYVSLLLAGQSDKAQVIKTIYEADFEINAPKAAAKYLEIVDEYPEAAIFFNRAIGNKETKIVDNLIKLNGQQMLNYQKLLANPLLDQVAEAYVGLVSTGKTEFAEMLFDSTKSSNISEKEMQTIRTKEILLNITGDHQQHQSEKSDAIMRAYNVSTAKSLNGRDIIFDNLMKMIQSGSYTRQEITTATINSNLPSDCTTAFDFVLRGVEYKHKLNEQAELADQDGLYYARFDDSDWLSITSLSEPVITQFFAIGEDFSTSELHIEEVFLRQREILDLLNSARNEASLGHGEEGLSKQLQAQYLLDIASKDNASIYRAASKIRQENPALFARLAKMHNADPMMARQTLSLDCDYKLQYANDAQTPTGEIYPVIRYDLEFSGEAHNPKAEKVLKAANDQDSITVLRLLSYATTRKSLQQDHNLGEAVKKNIGHGETMGFWSGLLNTIGLGKKYTATVKISAAEKAAKLIAGEDIPEALTSDELAALNQGKLAKALGDDSAYNHLVELNELAKIKIVRQTASQHQQTTNTLPHTVVKQQQMFKMEVHAAAILNGDTDVEPLTAEQMELIEQTEHFTREKFEALKLKNDALLQDKDPDISHEQDIHP